MSVWGLLGEVSVLLWCHRELTRRCLARGKAQSNPDNQIIIPPQPRQSRPLSLTVPSLLLSQGWAEAKCREREESSLWCGVILSGRVDVKREVKRENTFQKKHTSTLLAKQG